MKSEKGIISSSCESLTNVDRACILSPPFYFWPGMPAVPAGRGWAGFSKMEFAAKIGKFTERSAELKDKRKTGNKTARWNRQSITTWARYVAGEIKSTEPLDMRGN